MDSYIIIIGCVLCMCIVIIVCAYMVSKAQKERREALERELSEKTEFLSRISYDIRTPMNSIIGTAALGMEETDNPEKMKECLSKISASSQFLLGLLNDLVDMSKIENGKFHLHPRAYAYKDFIAVIRTMIEPMCVKKEIELEMPAEDININMEVDPLRYKQLFFNLLTNAVKYTPEHGKVRFRICNYATHNERFSADYIVEDTGIGMSEEFQQILFEPFAQETVKMTDNRNGVGLGLAITRSIVDLMGGTIEIESALGKGTKVKVHLDVPIALVQPEKTETYKNADETRKILSGKKVLLVEDHPLNVEMIKKILEKQEMKVVCAENGEAAVEMFRSLPEHYFDVVLMDIIMPVMDGMEATWRIRHTPHRDAQIIPGIAMTAESVIEDVNYYKDAGMNDIIEKPMEPKKIYEMLCAYLAPEA